MERIYANCSHCHGTGGQADRLDPETREVIHSFCAFCSGTGGAWYWPDDPRLPR